MKVVVFGTVAAMQSAMSYFNDHRNRTAFLLRVPHSVLIHLRSIASHEKKSLNHLIVDHLRHKIDPPDGEILFEPFASLLQEFHFDISAMIYCKQPNLRMVFLILNPERKIKNGYAARVQALRVPEAIQVVFLVDPRAHELRQLEANLWYEMAVDSKVLYDKGDITQHLIKIRLKMASGSLRRKEIAGRTHWIELGEN